MFEGVAPITDRDRLQAQMDRPLGGRPRGSDSQIGGLFDPLDPARTDLFDLVPVGRTLDDEGGELVVTRSKAELAEELDADDEFAEQLGLCLGGSAT